ncbi:MAG TPA: hypothetical protein VKT51_06325 [Candidatus Eremiobacteraceae bacterium]|nr:hypothetical protein [Candidatus Eremiobacteraceae bacterium]
MVPAFAERQSTGCDRPERMLRLSRVRGQSAHAEEESRPLQSLGDKRNMAMRKGRKTKKKSAVKKVVQAVKKAVKKTLGKAKKKGKKKAK